MISICLKRWLLTIVVASTGISLSATDAEAERSQQGLTAHPATVTSPWSSPAKLHHAISKEAGTIAIDAGGISFRSQNGGVIRWTIFDVRTFFVSSHKLTIETYENRKHHVPGLQRYEFDLSLAIPAQAAAFLADRIQRPSQNAVPDSASAGAVIHAHHRTTAGGTNGELRFDDSGISYVSKTGGDNRSWRWADLQTLSRPDPYQVLIFGYRDTYRFDLKEPLPQSLFNRATHSIDAADSAVAGRGSDR